MYSGSCLGAGARAGSSTLRSARRRCHIGHQPLVAGAVFAGQHDRLAHRRVLGQPRLDLAQLDAEAADLDLVVDAAEELDAAVGQPAAPGRRSGTAARRARRERVGDEALGGQLGPVEIAAGHAGAADVDLAGHADRHRLPLRVQDVEPGVGDRPADGDARPARGYV